MARSAITGLSNLPTAGSYSAGVDIKSLSSNVRVALPDTSSTANVVEVYGFDDPIVAGSGVPPQGQIVCRLSSDDFSFQINNDALPSYIVFYRTAGADTIAPIIEGETSTARTALTGLANLAASGSYAAGIDITSLSNAVRVGLPNGASTANVVDVYGFDDSVNAGTGTPVGGNLVGRLYNGAFSFQINTRDLPGYLVFYRTAGADTIAPIILGNPNANATAAAINVKLGGITKSTFTPTKVSAFAMLIHTIVKYDPTSGAFILTLPSAVGLTPDETVVTVNVSTSNNVVTVATVSSQTILGNGGVAATTYALNQAGQWCTFVSDGTNWLVAPGQ